MKKTISNYALLVPVFSFFIIIATGYSFIASLPVHNCLSLIS